MVTLAEAQITFRQALVYMEQAIWRATPGDKETLAFGGSWTVETTNGDLVACDVVHGGDADLITLMYNILPAQMELLKTASKINDLENPVFQAALKVAENIVK